MIKVGDYFKTKTGALGVVVILIGGGTPRELYGDMAPGAESGYEYFTLYVDKNLRYGRSKVQLMPLNRYAIGDVTKISKREYNQLLR